MNETAVHPDDLVTLTTRPTEFEAEAVVAVLAEAGIEAVAFGAIRTALPLSDKITPVPVQVRLRDLEAARAALKQNVADSVDLDWDEVDVGERIDNLPLTAREGLPLLALVGYICAAALLAAMFVGFVVLLVTRF